MKHIYWKTNYNKEYNEIIVNKVVTKFKILKWLWDYKTRNYKDI